MTMTDRGRMVTVLFVAVAALTLLPSHAFAYIGPGAGLSAFGSLLALVAAVVVALFGFVWYPIKRVIRMLKARRTADDGIVAVASDRT